MKQLAADTVSAAMGGLVEVSRRMHQNPELAFEEYETANLLTEFLASRGLAIEKPAYGLDTAWVARAGHSGPQVVICAEMDALPAIGHACGHNVIAAASLGAGIALAPIAEELGIRLTVLGTPAEELYGGKIDLINAGAFEDVAMAMMIHPAPHDVVDPTVIAVAHWDVEFHGKTSHASAYPELGINALDAFVQAYNNISMLRQATLPTDKIHGVITHGGDAANIIPHYTRSSWYVRAAKEDRLQELIPKVRACFEGAAAATGCTVEIHPQGHTYTHMEANPLLADLYAANSTELGRPMLRGSDLPASESGSTDMGNVSLVVPAIHPELDIDAGGAVNHQPEYTAATVTEAANRAIRDGAVAMAWTVIDVAEKNLWEDLRR
ncbi:MAG: M20 family metallopeptidase [Acidimicrobiia bacterium]|nr:M20 family metallopeptidase [Acidimicrobiia bacterium]